MASFKNHVLLLDDHKDTCVLVAYYLGMEGFDVTTANTLSEASSLMKERSFDLYLLDARLPDGFGIDLCLDIRAGGSCVPVIICSGDVRKTKQEEALRAGAQAFIGKPTKPDELVNIIHVLVRGASADA